MIIFHEGLPRSGKTYEAMVKHVLPALAKGRRVIGYIEGMDFAKIAAVLSIPEQRVRELLVPIERERVPQILEWVENGALIVVDEVQNFWPMEYREKLDAKLMQLIAEHGRRAMDILIIGQCFADVHAAWRRRTSMRVEFMKREAIGRPDEYTWRMYKATAPEKWAHITSGSGKYEAKYFDTYSSYDADVPEVTAYVDERAVIWNHKAFRVWLPVFGVALAVALYYIFSLFTGRVDIVEAKTVALPPPVERPEPVRVVHAPAPVPPPAPVAEVVQVPAEPEDLVTRVAARARPRLAAVLVADGRAHGLIEWYEAGSSRVVERLDFRALEALDWSVTVTGYGVELRRGERWYQVTQWPLYDAPTQVSEARTQEIREAGAGVGISQGSVSRTAYR